VLQEHIPGAPRDASWIFDAYLDGSTCRFAATGRKIGQYPVDAGMATATDNCDPSVDVTYADGTVTEVTATGQFGWALSVAGAPPTSTAGFAAGPSVPPLGTGSRVTLTHGGWGALGEIAAILRREYASGRQIVLGEAFADFVDGRDQ